MEKDHRVQPQTKENKTAEKEEKDFDALDKDASLDNESLFHRLGEVNVMPDGMLSPVNETNYVNSIINENAQEVDDEKDQKK